jgi:hypothetical protein
MYYYLQVTSTTAALADAADLFQEGALEDV